MSIARKLGNINFIKKGSSWTNPIWTRQKNGALPPNRDVQRFKLSNFWKSCPSLRDCCLYCKVHLRVSPLRMQKVHTVLVRFIFAEVSIKVGQGSNSVTKQRQILNEKGTAWHHATFRDYHKFTKSIQSNSIQLKFRLVLQKILHKQLC